MSARVQSRGRACAIGVLLPVLEGSDVVHRDDVTRLGEILVIAGRQNFYIDAHGGWGGGEPFGVGVVEWLRADCGRIAWECWRVELKAEVVLNMVEGDGGGLRVL